MMALFCDRCGEAITDPGEAVVNEEGIFHQWCLRDGEEADPLPLILIELGWHIFDNDTVHFYYELYHVIENADVDRSSQLSSGGGL